MIQHIVNLYLAISRYSKNKIICKRYDMHILNFSKPPRIQEVCVFIGDFYFIFIAKNIYCILKINKKLQNIDFFISKYRKARKILLKRLYLSTLNIKYDISYDILSSSNFCRSDIKIYISFYYHLLYFGCQFKSDKNVSSHLYVLATFHFHTNQVTSRFKTIYLSAFYGKDLPVVKIFKFL